MTTADRIYELVKAMPEAQANLVLTFAEFLQRGEWVHSEAKPEMQQDQDVDTWRSLVRELSGAWADFPEAEGLRATAVQDVAREPF